MSNLARNVSRLVLAAIVGSFLWAAILIVCGINRSYEHWWQDLIAFMGPYFYMKSLEKIAEPIVKEAEKELL